MFQFSQPPSNHIIMIAITILVNLITFTSSEITRINVIEREDTALDFSYPCNSSEITLRHGHKAPFYDSASPVSTSLPDNLELTVHEERNECFIRLFFTPALRSDKGGYILTSYTDDRTFLEDTRIWLEVDYPPDRVSCGWSGEDIRHGWVSLQCTAPAGELPGEIICYQNGIILPSIEKRTPGDILEQTNLIRHSQPAFCCAAVIGRPVDRCDCKDYIWDPNRNVTDPCPLTTPKVQQHDSTPSQTYTLLSAPTKKQGYTERQNSNATKLSFSLPLGALVVIVIGLIVALILSRRRASKDIMSMEHEMKNFERIRNDYVGVSGLET